MPGITAILHTRNDELRIARAIESLRSCDDVLVIDYRSSDQTCSIARRFGARTLNASDEGVGTKPYLHEAQHDWVLCLHATESLSEALEASIFEWKLEEHPHAD